MLLFGMLAAVGCSQGTNAIALTPEADAPVAVSLASAKPIYTAAGEGADGATPLKSPNSIRVDYKLTVKEKAPSGAAVFAKIACNVGDYVLSTPYTPEVELDKHAAGEEISESISFGYWMGHPVLSSMPEVCEVSFRYKGVKNDPSTYKSLGKACYTKESLSNGPCADELLKRKKSGAGPVTIEKLEARVVEQTSGADKGKPALDGLLVATLHKELRPTSNKELGAGVLAKAACRTETKDLPEVSLAFVPLGDDYELGDSASGSGMPTTLEEKPTSCNIKVFFRDNGPPDIPMTELGTFCLTAPDTLKEGACPWTTAASPETAPATEPASTPASMP